MTGSLTSNSDSKAAVLTVNFASSSSALSTCFHPLCRAPLHCFRKYLHVEAFRIGIGIRKGRILLRVQTPQPESTIPDLIATFYVTYRYSGIFRGNKQFFKSLPALRFRNRRQKHLLHGNSPFSTVLQQFQYAIHMVFIWVRYKHTA